MDKLNKNKVNDFSTEHIMMMVKDQEEGHRRDGCTGLKKTLKELR